MITPAIIRKKVTRWYPDFLRAWLAGEDFFPKELPADKGKSTDDLELLREGFRKLLPASKDKRGFGYRVELAEVNTRRHGRQSMPSKIWFDTEEDFLKFIGEEEAFGKFKRDVATIRATLPGLEAWMPQNYRLLLKYTGDWPQLLEVCRYFLEHPRPGRYLRELPVKVHTKFIEERKEALRSLLDFLLPPEAVEPSFTGGSLQDFCRRFHLRYDEPLIRFRLLDDSIGGLSDLSIPVSDFASLSLPVGKVFMVENKMNFLTFPRHPQSMVIWGKGFAVELLKEAAWMAEKELWYWGDLDAAGFEILSRLRAFLPAVQSFLMDAALLKTYAAFAHPEPNSQEKNLAHLTPEEHDCYVQLVRNDLRLEQERIPNSVVEKFLMN